MRKSILIAAISIASLYAPAATAASVEETCNNVAYMAERIMAARQKGVAFGDAYGMTNKPEYSTIRQLAQAVVVHAFKEPRFDTDEYQQRAISDFRDEYHVACITALSE